MKCPHRSARRLRPSIAPSFFSRLCSPSTGPVPFQIRSSAAEGDCERHSVVPYGRGQRIGHALLIGANVGSRQVRRHHRIHRARPGQRLFQRRRVAHVRNHGLRAFCASRSRRLESRPITRTFFAGSEQPFRRNTSRMSRGPCNCVHVSSSWKRAAAKRATRKKLPANESSAKSLGFPHHTLYFAAEGHGSMLARAQTHQ